MKARRIWVVTGVLVLAVAACAPAATPTSSPLLTPTPLQWVTPVPDAALTPTASARASPTSTPTPVVTSAPAKREAAKPKYGGRVVVSGIEDPGSWDVNVQSAQTIHSPMSFVYSKMVVYNVSKPCTLLPVESDLAESWNWTDDVTLEVKLRKGVRFHNLPPVNGRELLAEDVVFSVKRYFEMAPKARDLASNTVTVQDVDSSTIRFKLKTPFSGYLTEGLSSEIFWVMAPEAGGPEDRRDRPDQQIGTGPFMLGKYTVGVGITFRKNPSYFRTGLPFLDEITYRVIPDFSTRLAALRSAKLDGTEIREPASILTLKQVSPEIQITQCSEARGPVIYLRNDQEPFRDVRVRRAISMAIDREALIRTAYSGIGEVRTGPLLPVLGPYYLTPDEVPQEIRRYIRHDPEAARRLLAEAGYSRGFKTELTYTSALAPYWSALMEGVVDMLSQVGIEVKLKPQDYPLFLQTVVRAKYDGMGSSWATATTPDDAAYKWLYGVKSTTNRNYIFDDKLNEMLNASRIASQEQDRIKVFKEIQRYVIDNAFQIYLPVTAWAYAIRPDIRDVVANPEMKIMGYWWLRAWRE